MKNADIIKIRGAREHNLKNIDLDIPKNKLVVFTGVSGSGKSSLAMDTIYAEGQRRYVESLSSYARQFLGVLSKPDVDLIEGLSPAIAIDQKTTSKNPRSTVGTVTEIYDYLRVLYARVGRVIDPTTGRVIKRQSPEEITDNIINLIKNDTDIKLKSVWGYILAPLVSGRKGEYSKMFNNLQKQGFARVRIDGNIYNLSDDITLIKTNKHSIDVVVDRVVVGKTTFKKIEDEAEFKSKLFSSCERALKLSGGKLIYSKVLDKAAEFPDKPKNLKDTIYSEEFSFEDSSIQFPEIEPRIFSFNTPHGACTNCSGLGTILEFNIDYMMNKGLSVMEGGIFPLGNIGDKDTWYKRKIEAVANTEGINLYKPIKECSPQQLNILLYGSKKQYTASGKNSRDSFVSFDFEFEGIFNELTRRYKETESDYIKNELQQYMLKKQCPVCNGARLKETSLYVKINNLSIAEFCNLSIIDSLKFIISLETGDLLTSRESEIAKAVIKEIKDRLTFLINVGLDYLTLSRSSASLAGGEAQRIRLASQIGSGLSGVLYVLDEPSIGLHATDHTKLITTLKHLKSLGNTVIVVEHDSQTMLESDYIVDFGPGAGYLGGEVIAKGTPEEIMKDPNSLTGRYLSGKKVLDYNSYLSLDELNTKSKHSSKFLKLYGASGHNLKNVDVEIPLGKLVCITGVSGSGKSTLVNETILRALRAQMGLKNNEAPMSYTKMEGYETINKIIDIDQSPIGRTPRSNPATYTKAFDEIRKIYASTMDAKIKGYKEGRFSFNVKGGRCEGCKGDGQIKIEMQFMPDVYVKCEVCGGKRYTSEVLDVYFKDKNIDDILNTSVEEALKFFNAHASLTRKLQTLYDVGLGYLKLGQMAPTLSGGEAQRIKLATELCKMQRGHTLYILDEPTTGLHFYDLEKLIAILKKLVAKGNTVLVIEHNLDVIKASDYIIDLGPGGGANGGTIIATGTPEEIENNKNSKTGLALRELYYL